MATRFTFPCGSLFGIPIRVHFLLPLLGVVLVVTTPEFTDRGVLLPLLTFFGVVAVSTLAHEFGHAFAGRHHRLEVMEIVLWPLGGFTTLESPRNFRSRLQVALAGVSVNFLLALLAGGGILLRGEALGFPRLGAGPDLLHAVWGLNVVLGTLNLLPGLPWDGGMALEALLSRRFGRGRSRLAVIVTGGLVNAGLLFGGLAARDFLLATVGGWCLFEVVNLYRAHRQWEAEDQTFLGVYDFSKGYTSLEESAPGPDREERRRERKRERAAREAERSETAAASARADAQERLDGLLDRIATEGIATLNDEERAFLDEESRRLRALRRGKTPTRP
jgi:Zn-dependent protease